MPLQNVVLKLKAVPTDAFTRTAAFIGVIGVIAAVGVPFVLSAFGGRQADSLPWYIWTIGLLLFLLVITVGRFMFMNKTRHAEDISIRPRYR